MSWISTKDQSPEPGDLIVKRWKSGSVWAGRYSPPPGKASQGDSGFDEWFKLHEAMSNVDVVLIMARDALEVLRDCADHSDPEVHQLAAKQRDEAIEKINEFLN